MPGDLQSIIKDLGSLERQARQTEIAMRSLEQRIINLIQTSTTKGVLAQASTGQATNAFNKLVSGERSSISGMSFGGGLRATKNEGEVAYVDSLIAKYKDLRTTLDNLRVKTGEYNAEIDKMRSSFQAVSGKFVDQDIRGYYTELDRARSVADNLRISIEQLKESLVDLVYASRGEQPFLVPKLMQSMEEVISGQRAEIAGAPLGGGDRVTRSKTRLVEINAVITKIKELRQELENLGAIEDIVTSKILQASKNANIGVYGGIRLGEKVPLLPAGQPTVTVPPIPPAPPTPTGLPTITIGPSQYPQLPRPRLQLPPPQYPPINIPPAEPPPPPINIPPPQYPLLGAYSGQAEQQYQSIVSEIMSNLRKRVEDVMGAPTTGAATTTEQKLRNQLGDVSDYFKSPQGLPKPPTGYMFGGTENFIPTVKRLGGLSTEAATRAERELEVKILQKMREAYKGIDEEIVILEPRVRKLSDGFVATSATIKDLGQIHQIFSPLGKEVTKLEYEKEAFSQTPISKSGISATAQAELNKNIDNWKQIQGITNEFQSFGTTITNVDETTKKFTTTVTDLAGAQSQLVQYTRNANQVLSEQNYKDLLKLEEAQKMMAGLEGRIGKTAAENVYATVGKYKFRPQDITGIHTQQPTGVSTITFKQWDEAAQTFQTMEVTVDKFGRVLSRTNRRLQGFFESIIKNTGELIRWSIGVGLVYGSYYKFQELIKLAVDNQTKLVDVSVALGDTQRDLNDIFSDAADVADRTGESINDVLEAYTMTYRAVGAIQNPIERTAAANKLLADSTTLNKLSALDSAESIDVLSGALRQAQTEFERVGQKQLTTTELFAKGSDLLDQWVKVTQIANVDLATLSLAFSVTAESALNAGTSIEELNAIIAVLSEKIGGLGGKETGNAVRALIGGVYQQQAVDILTQYGVAVTDSTGKMRDFLKISKDINDLYQSGIIDAGQLNKIAYTLGGGVRRGQQYVAFLKDLQRVQEIVVEQQNVSGVAQEALNRKMSTVATSSTRVSNAFQTLAQTMGSEGGLLGSMTNLNNILTLLIKGFTELSKIAGSFTIPATALAAFGLVTGFGRNAGLTGRLLSGFDWAGSRVQDLGKLIGERRSGTRYTSEGYLVDAYTSRGKIPQAIGAVPTGVGKAIASQYGPAIALGILGSLPKLGEGDVKAFGANIAGSIIGGLLGAAAGPGGAAVGTVIGGGIADAFYRSVIAYSPQFEEAIRGKRKAAPGVTETAKELPETVQEEYIRRLFEEYAKYQNTRTTILGTKPLGPQLTPEQAQGTATVQSWFENLRVAIFGKGGELYPTAPEEAFQQLERVLGADSPIIKELRDLKETGISYQTEAIPLQKTPLFQFQQAGEKAFGDLLDDVVAKQRNKLQTQLIGGEITSREYTNKVQALPGLKSIAIKLYGEQNKLAQESLQLTKANEDEIASYMQLITDNSDEAKQSLVELVTEYYDLEATVESFKGSAPDRVIDALGTTYSELGDKVLNTREAIDALIESMKNAALTEVRLPDITKVEDLTRKQFDRIYALAKELQDREFGYLEDQQLLTPEQADRMKATAEPLYYDLGKEIGFYIANGITDAKFIQEAIQQAAQEGISGLDYQFMSDVTQAQFASIMPQYNAIRNSIIAQGGTSEETGLLTFFKDATSPVYMKADWKIVQYLLQQILKTEEKQLDGIYNLPSGASFYVPFQAWKMDTETRQAMAGAAQGPVDVNVTSDLEPPVDKFGQYVEEFGGVFQGFVGKYSRENLTRKDEQLINELRLDKKYGKVGSATEYNPEQAFIDEWSKKWAELQRAAGKIQPLTPYVNENGQPVNVPPRAPATTGEASALEEAIKNAWKLSLPGVADTSFADAIGAVLAVPIDKLSTSIENQINSLNSFIEQLKQGFGIGTNIGGAQGSTTIPVNYVPDVKTSLNLEVSTQTQLIVDGRVLADILKPYLWQDLVSYQNSAGTSAGTFTAV